ncbi:hypothetical protein DL769_006857 [Monosporascus sp. CRB-8-3]|nr:hypothetical protein DL769_006857 [Monosporascus sp. CRB-8-3]
MDHLKSIDVRLGLRQAVERRAFREKLVQSVERVIQKKLDSVYCSETAVPQLAKHIDLGKVTELPATMCRFHEELGSWTVFKDAFGGNLETTIKLEDLTRKDIRRYVTDSFNAHEQFQKLSLMDLVYADLVEEVVRKARGTARSFQIALSRDEPLPLISYGFVDDVEEDPGLNYNTALKLGADQIEAKLAVMWRRLEGRSKGLLEVVVSNTKDKDGAKVDYLVEFLHRTVRDFLLHTPDIQDEMMESLENKYQTWLFYFARLAVTDSGDEDIVDDVLLQVFPRTKRSTAISGVTHGEGSHQGVGCFDILFASQYGLVSYVKKQLPWRLQLIEEASPADREKKRASILGGVLRHALLGEDSYCKLSPELVEYLVSLGSSANHLCKVKCQATEATVFYHFLRRVEKEEISPKEPGVLEIIKTLVTHNADLNAGVTLDLNAETARMWKGQASESSKARDIIYKCFTVDEADWIFSHSTKSAPTEPEGGNIGVPTARQQNEDSVDSQPIDGPTIHHAQTAAAHKQDGTCSPNSQASTTSAPKRLYNLYAVKVDNVSRKAVVDKNGGIRRGITEALSEENNVTVVNIAWLGRRDMLNPKAYGSIVVYVGSSDDVSQLLSCGTFRVGGRGGHTRALEKRPAAIQCYNCQQLGHKAINCGNAEKKPDIPD